MEQKALTLLRFLSAGAFRSGEEIAGELGCSRAAVWKQVESLRQLGVPVEAVAGSGYRLAEKIELLEPEWIKAALGEQASAHLNALEVWPALDSTNSEVQRRPQASQHGLAVLAERQTAGRGRRGRHWFSPLARNLYLSVGWRFETGIGELAPLPLVLALATAEALQACGLSGHGIKWPNDILVHGRKLAGCLVEVQGDASGPCSAVLGVGVNVRMSTGVAGAVSIDQPWTDVAGQVPDVSRNRLAALLITRLLGHLLVFERQGFGAFATTWEALDGLAGKAVDIASPAGRIHGTARGVSLRGGLLLDTAQGHHEVLAGEVSVRPRG